MDLRGILNGLLQYAGYGSLLRSSAGAVGAGATRESAAAFLDFGLAGRYAVKAAEHLGTIEGQIHAMKSIGASNEIICAVLLVPGIEHAPFPNHWQRGMYQALRDHVSANECEQSDSHCDGAKKVFKRESHTSFCAPGAAGSQIL